MEVSVGVDSFPHLVRSLGMSPDISRIFSSGTAGLISGARPSKRLLMSLRSSSIFSTKSTRMGITFAAEIRIFAMLLLNSLALFLYIAWKIDVFFQLLVEEKDRVESLDGLFFLLLLVIKLGLELVRFPQQEVVLCL